MSEIVDGIILVVNGLIKSFDVTFLMVRKPVDVGILRCESERPDEVCQWIVVGT